MTPTPQTEAVSDFMERHFKHLRDGRKEYTEAEVRSIMLAFEAELRRLDAVEQNYEGLKTDYQRLMEKHNNLHINAKQCRDERDQLRAEVNEQARLLGISAERELALRAQVERLQGGEPFGYFKAEPFGWTNCAATDEGAIPLYEAPRAALARAIDTSIVTDTQIKSGAVVIGDNGKPVGRNTAISVWGAMCEQQPAAPALSHEVGADCRQTVIWSLMASKAWTSDYAEAYIDNRLGFRTAAPALVPLSRDKVKELMSSGGYDDASIQERADFINGIRHGELAHGIGQSADLWCIHIPGPDDVHAAPSKEAAEHMAERHNKAMTDYYSSNHPNLEFAPSLESVKAVVIAWPHDQQEHADELREFDWAGWGIAKPVGGEAK